MEPQLLRWLFLPAGALVGYLWYRIIGCRTGMCPLTQNPWSSMGLGMVLSYLFLIR